MCRTDTFDESKEQTKQFIASKLPFCASEAELIQRIVYGKPAFRVKCVKCDVSTALQIATARVNFEKLNAGDRNIWETISPKQAKLEAISIWNTRI